MNLLQDSDRHCRDQCPRVTTGHRDGCREGSGQNRTSLGIKTPHTLGLGWTGLDTMNTMHDKPAADGILNGEKLSASPSRPGRRQGRPLSPPPPRPVRERRAGRSSRRGQEVKGTCVSAASRENWGKESHTGFVFQSKNVSLRHPITLISFALRPMDRLTDRQVSIL